MRSNTTCEDGLATEGVLAGERARLLAAFEKVIGRYLPASGALRPWKLAEIEVALLQDGQELARTILEARLRVDPLQDPKRSMRCPQCGTAMPGDPEKKTHKKTIFGTIHYSRGYGYCRSCGAAFSPSGESVGLRQGLL